ncbi:oxidoreductase [Xylariaceae sp. FL0804]|nr:oxidoreductase [Xylariaceae sp. FL0804]
MPPSGLAILLGAGPVLGHGIARALAHPSQGNMAVALLARRRESLDALVAQLERDAPGCVCAGFVADAADPRSLEAAFAAVDAHQRFDGLKLRAAVFNVKSPSRVPYADETVERFVAYLGAYVGGAFAFSQLATRRFWRDHGEAPLSADGDGGKKKGTLIFTGVTGALKCNANFAAYGAARAGVRQLAQSMARELSDKGLHVVHTIANGHIRAEVDDDVRCGKAMSAEAAGKVYLQLVEQEPQLWTHELDMRPAQEKF